MKKQKEKRTYLQTAVLRNCKTDFGLGVGVIAEREITFTDQVARGFNSPLFLMQVAESNRQFLDTLVGITLSQKITLKRKGGK